MESPDECTRRQGLPARLQPRYLLPLYDPLVRLIGADRTRLRLLEQARIGAGDRVLDVGCGTGTFVAAIKRRAPGAEVSGIDPDPHALERARRKLARTRVDARLDRGFGGALPYRAGAFDRVSGYCWMLNGNMLCGVEVGRYMFRVGKALEAEALRRPGATPMDNHGPADARLRLGPGRECRRPRSHGLDRAGRALRGGAAAEVTQGTTRANGTRPNSVATPRGPAD